MIISKLLIDYRMRNALTQKQMSDLLGISQVGYHKWETGSTKVEMEHYCRIATLCEVRLIDLLPREWQEKIREDLGV
ncbi:helix-turn-helix transcriptional regulator [Dyadobacter sp. OTU695]|uniref:helix-turn-helix transcriptional regulator n=1 Tax=Dyadobacter sp. OTU695 TaxID=3043860 RepID=UPI00313C0E5C